MMNYTDIEIEGMKELLKENELEIGRLRKDIKNLKEERDFFKDQAILWRNDYKNEYEENKKLKEENSYRKKIVDIIPQDEKSVAEETIQDLQERIRFLEQCLDRKEKVNKEYRKELENYVYDAKQVRDIC